MVRTFMALAAALALAPLAARAQADVTTQTTTTYETPEQFRQTVKPTVGIMGEIGVNRYAGQLAAPTEPGVAYGVRIDLSPSRNLGLEIAYAGANNKYNSRFSGNGSLWTNQAGGDLRLNLVPPGFDLPGHIRPFIFGGVAYQSVITHNFTPGATDANLLAVPTGAGIETDIGGKFLLGVRGTYNFLFYEKDNFGGSASNWGVTADLGARL